METRSGPLHSCISLCGIAALGIGSYCGEDRAGRTVWRCSRGNWVFFGISIDPPSSLYTPDVFSPPVNDKLGE